MSTPFLAFRGAVLLFPLHPDPIAASPICKQERQPVAPAGARSRFPAAHAERFARLGREGARHRRPQRLRRCSSGRPRPEQARVHVVRPSFAEAVPALVLMTAPDPAEADPLLGTRSPAPIPGCFPARRPIPRVRALCGCGWGRSPGRKKPARPRVLPRRRCVGNWVARLQRQSISVRWNRDS